MRFLPLLMAVVASPAAEACLWDGDTIASEKARFPGVDKVIFGEFPRHSREFYEWRKKESEAGIAADPSRLELYDDLAVAQHKLGDHQGAIETMKTKDGIKPGLYETLSNTGTFYIYTGDLSAALGRIEKALEVNPNAHFGREKYQKWLIEWMLEGRPEEKANMHDPNLGKVGFAGWVAKKHEAAGEGKELTEPIRKEAIQAVLGMMRFADFDNPILQEILGDLLISGMMDKNASIHASFAYLSAYSRVQEPEARKRLTEKFQWAAGTIQGGDPKLLAELLKKGLAKGARLTGGIRHDEIAWIAAGKDVSAEFNRKYLRP
ncbi:hypothetical protein OVA24_02920 [Luteolibacter sp. SL250]|uniref:hypothetical protein n=1 Tax=Luteolibacter sp. SL250 TaxID=2995170 RepID=UPI00226FE0F6|nr:hypothetical protein [Luteolibacter sp. SL250]WAC20331.1 hypothetical protein OVA24_02920 [Luteolibacter sp. SL250]